MKPMKLEPVEAGRTVAKLPRKRTRTRTVPGGIMVGELVGFGSDRSPLVVYDGQAQSAALPAATTIDLHAAHVGRRVVLMFERHRGERPIVMGVLRDFAGWPLEERPGGVEVVADGERLVVSAREQLVLECGNASITLTRAGKIIIHGSYVSSRSSGVMRIKGGSIELN